MNNIDMLKEKIINVLNQYQKREYTKEFEALLDELNQLSGSYITTQNNSFLNKMLNFLYKNRIIKNLTAVTKFSVLENEEFSCSWSEWFRELWRCLRDDFLTFWKSSYKITKAVILKKFLNEFDKISVKLDNNKSTSITLSELLKEVNEFIPISETTKLQK